MVEVDKYNSYLELLSKTYEEAVIFLLQKYGPAQDDYFREKSYQRFLNGEIKSITKGKTTRTNEGLYCHHIDENKWLKASDKEFVRKYQIPFESQRKDRLIYCDLIEHSILHVLIAKETSLEFGNPGFMAYLRPDIEIWYLDKEVPHIEWEKNCYNKSFLIPQEAFGILKEMQRIIGGSYFSTLFDYYEEKRKQEEERKTWLQSLKQNRIADREKWIERTKNLHSKSPRNEIIAASYSIRIEYKDLARVFIRNSLTTREEYISEMKKYTKEKILDDLLIYIENLPEIVD